MFNAISDFWLNIGEALKQLVENIGGWDWETIVNYLKNISLGSVGVVFLKFAIPFFKNSNKPILNELAKQKEIVQTLNAKIQSLEEKDQTIGNVLTEWIGLQANTNLVSKTLTDEQKQAFVDLAAKMRLIQIGEVQVAAEKIEQIVDDKIVHASEIQDLVKSTKIGEQILGTNINSITSRG